MSWKGRRNGPDFENNIITAFLQHYSLLEKDGYWKQSSVWGVIAGKLYCNTMQFRKWLYNFWHDNRRELRTKTIMLLQAEENSVACKEHVVRKEHTSSQYDKDCSPSEMTKATHPNVDSDYWKCLGKEEGMDLRSPQTVLLSHSNTAENEVGSQCRPLFPDEKDIFSSSVKNQQYHVEHDHQSSESGTNEKLGNTEMVVRNSTLQQMLTTELPVRTSGEFKASCVPSFHITLCISEWRKIYLSSSQSGLKDDWTTLLGSKIKEYNKFCVFTFKYNRIKKKRSRKRNAPFWYGKAKCKFNGCTMLHMSIKDMPKKEASTVRIQINVKGQICHQIGHEYKRHTRLPERIKLREELKGDTPSQLRLKLINRCESDALIAGNHNDIKSCSVLQKISSEGNLDGRTAHDPIQDCRNIQARQDSEEHFLYKTGHSYLQVISSSPFELHMYMEVQLHLLLDLQRAGLCDLCLDATGSVVKKPPGIRRQILYYALCTKIPADSSNIIPVAEMLTSDHSTPNISRWLGFLSRDMFRVTGNHLKPQKIECDHSWVLIHAATEVLNHVTPLQYLFMCYDVCVNDKTLDFTVVHICAAHMIKLMVGHVSKLKLSPDMKNFFLYTFALLQNGKTLQECAELVKCLSMVLGAKYLTDRCKVAITAIQQDLKRQKISVPDEEFHLKDDIMETSPDSVYQKSPFVKLIPQENFEDDVLNRALLPNTYYNPELKKLLSKYIRTLPLWSGIMLQGQHCPKTRDSNSSAENWFRIVKSQVLNSKLHRRPAEFVAIMKDTIQGRLRVAAMGIFKENNSKKEVLSRGPTKNTKNNKEIPHPLTVEETWGKRPQSALKKVPKYYRAPAVSLQKGKCIESDCPPWNGTAQLCRKKVVLRNTCTIDNLLYMIHRSMEQYPHVKTEISALRSSVGAINTLLRVNEAFLEKRWSDGKMEWLLQFEMFQGKSLWDCYGTEEEMVTSRLSYFWDTVQYSTCSDQNCSKKESHINSTEIMLCLSNAQEVQNALNIFHEPFSSPCTMHFVEGKHPSVLQNDTRITVKKCRGERQMSSRVYVNGLPCLLIITVAVISPYRNNDQFDPRNFPAVISVDSVKYKVVGITYNVGQHFVCFHKFGNNGKWHLYDGLKEYQTPGHGNIEATEPVFSNILQRHPVPNHIVAVRKT